jgi:hypothetical protein
VWKALPRLVEAQTALTYPHGRATIPLPIRGLWEALLSRFQLALAHAHAHGRAALCLFISRRAAVPVLCSVTGPYGIVGHVATILGAILACLLACASGCGKRFAQEYNLRTHMKSHYSSSQQAEQVGSAVDGESLAADAVQAIAPCTCRATRPFLTHHCATTRAGGRASNQGSALRRLSRLSTPRWVS